MESSNARFTGTESDDDNDNDDDDTSNYHDDDNDDEQFLENHRKCAYRSSNVNFQPPKPVPNYLERSYPSTAPIGITR